MHTAKILYESDGKAPNGQPFLTVKQARGYYEYSERPGMDSIAFILIDYNTNKIGLITESKPPLDERMGKLVDSTTAFGGSIDSNESYINICQTEVLEEAGYTIPLKNIIEVGISMVSTQSSQLIHGFLVDVTDIPKETQTEYEILHNEDRTVWADPFEIFNGNDWKAIWILAKAANGGHLRD